MLKYGTLEDRPAVITNSALARGYWFINGRWALMNPGDVTHNVILRTKESFEKRFPGLPPYPELREAMARLRALPTDPRNMN